VATSEQTTVFLTGPQRSGTTLLEKLLCNHTQVAILSQPFPYAFLEAKRAFLRSLGHEDRYPLGPLFAERRYDLDDFEAYLGSYQPEAATLRRLFADMADYSGQYTKFEEAEVDAIVGGLEPGDFAATVAQLYRGLCGDAAAAQCGGKEIVCEEFLPYLLSRAVRCLLILRDPRDILVSLNYGKGRTFGGDLKPTLFNLRQFRKAVAYAAQLEGRAGFAWLRYEDLVAEPIDCLNQVAAVLAVEPFTEAVFADGVRDQSGEIWKGNSSHSVRSSISSASVGAFAEHLPPEVVRYAEAACYPELRLLGYECGIEWAEAAAIVSDFDEPYEIVRQGLQGYSTDPANVADELHRIELLSAPAAPAASEARHYFLFEKAAERLRDAVQAR
jgi:hypothetical protein